jgi:catechol 2,3-dioxygenase-like lactoylglutathione lyase family enzyme|tara:strand:+ start:107 stop:538 length:432 start_codon:yes stop_codon:yes gene_type:complete
MKVRHVGVTVSDLSRSLSFYRDLLGFNIIKEMDEFGEHIDKFSGLQDIDVRTVKMSANDGGMIELLYYRSHPETNEENLTKDITKVGCSHFALTVKDLPSLYSKMLEDNITVMCEPQYSPDGNVRLTFCRDPDGTLIELVEEL